MNTRNTREETKENRENSGKSCRQINLHLLFEEPILLLVLLNFLWCFSVCVNLFFHPKHDIFIAQVISPNFQSWNEVKTSSLLHQRCLPVVSISMFVLKSPIHSQNSSKHIKTWGNYNNSRCKMWYMSEYFAHSSKWL